MMKIDKATTSKIHRIHLAFDPNTLKSLIREGKLHASDFNCLDQTSKKGVWAMMRSVAANNVRLS